MFTVGSEAEEEDDDFRKEGTNSGAFGERDKLVESGREEVLFFVSIKLSNMLIHFLEVRKISQKAAQTK